MSKAIVVGLIAGVGGVLLWLLSDLDRWVSNELAYLNDATSDSSQEGE